jgi:hypothetical protein
LEKVDGEHAIHVAAEVFAVPLLDVPAGHSVQAGELEATTA